MPGIFRLLYPGLTWYIKSDKPGIYLTFDDGPTPGITLELLSILQKYQAKATFFCIGRNVERHPDLYEAILNAGHSTGNHTYSHLKGWYTPDKEYYEDIQLASRFIHSDLFRPAYGMIMPKQIAYLKNNFRIVLWDVMSYDFAYNTTPQQCLKNVLKHTENGSVVVFHDSLKAAAKVLFALPRMLEYFTNQGYTFPSISHCNETGNLSHGNPVNPIDPGFDTP